MLKTYKCLILNEWKSKIHYFARHIFFTRTMIKQLTAVFLFITVFSFGQEGHNHALDKSYHRFIENKGQWDNKILYKSELSNAQVIVTQKGLIYNLKDNVVYGQYMKDLHDGKFNHDSTHYYTSASISLEFLNASRGSCPRGKKAYAEKRNYFIGQDSTKWGRNVLGYSEVETKNIYEDIDFKLYHFNNSVKYEFIVDPRKDYHQIKLKFTGQDKLIINKEGDLIIKNGVSDIIEDKPYAYQIIKGTHVEVECQYIKICDSIIGFELSKKYNKRYPVIIDPQLIFSTASGSTADNWGNTACLDKSGNLYSGGTVFLNDEKSDSSGFPTTFGSFQRKFQGGESDIGILKFDSSGQNLIYATYIGARFAEIPTSIITNDAGELFILGVTSSDNFPKAVNNFSGGVRFDFQGGYIFENGSDIIVMKLDATGSNLIKSIYVGGPLNDGNNIYSSDISDSDLNSNWIWSTDSYWDSPINNYGDELRGEIIIDKEDNIYIASSTNTARFDVNSTGFPIKNGFGPIYNGGTQDGVVFKIHHSLDSLMWSSYIGSEGNDAAMSLKLNSKNELLVTGACGANTFDYKASGIHPNFLGTIDGFVAKISNDGNSVLDYTYLGTRGKDISYFVEIDENDDVYLLGQTYGDYGFYPQDVYTNPKSGVFIHKLGKNLDTNHFYMTLGNAASYPYIRPAISPTAFLVNECGNIFISGWGGRANHKPSTGYTFNLPITNNAYQKTSDGSDFYMAAFEKDMKSLLYATYFGVDGVAEHVDGGTSRFSNSGIVYQSVCAGCSNNGEKHGNPFIIYPNNSQGEYPKQNASYNCNNGVFKFDLATLNARIGQDDGCGPLTHYFTNHTVGGIDYYWNFGDGTDTLVFTKETVKHTYQKAGSYKITMISTDLTTCKGKDTTSTIIYVSDRLKYQNFGDTLCKGETKLWDKYTDNEFNYEWSPAKGLSETNIKNPIITADSTIQYIVSMTDTLGCIRKDTVDIFVPFFIPNLSVGALAACQHLSIPKIEMMANYRSNFVPDSLSWKIDDFTITAIGDKFIFTPQNFGVHKVVVTAKNDNCSFSETSSINLPQIKIPNVITPNHDGKNDAFVIEGLEYGGTWSLLVVNRWGKEVFMVDDYRNNWDAPIEAPGTYFYEIEAPDGTKCKGWLQVVK